LGALKERSELSYGVLAKRLHVGTSTLHRYVQGETVPPEYGVIEKFARLTGATAAEMAELYRLWMAAVEARDAGSVAGRSSTVAEAAVSVEDAPIETPAVVATRRQRRLIPALAVVAVVGVGAAVAGAAFASSGSSDHPTVGSAARSTTASSATASASPSTPSVAPSTASSEPPIAVTIRPYQWEDKCEQWYLLNRKPSDVPPPPVEQDARGWATALGAVPAGTMKIELAVQGTSSDAVVLQGLHIRTVSKAAPLPWSAFSMASGCGGGLVPVSFDVNLDADRPLAHPTAGQQGDTVIPAVDFPFKVSKTDPQVLTIYAHARTVNVAWYLELDWSSGGQSGTVRIDDHGHPFHTSGAQGRPIYDYDTSSNSWLPDDTAVIP
jgi:hypothetical protein